MSKIKTRETQRGIKALDKVVVTGDRMKNALIRTKDETANLIADDGRRAPQEYAADNAQYAAYDGTRDIARFASLQGRKLAHKGREALRDLRKEAERNEAQTVESVVERAKDDSSQQIIEQNRLNEPTKVKAHHSLSQAQQASENEAALQPVKQRSGLADRSLPHEHQPRLPRSYQEEFFLERPMSFEEVKRQRQFYIKRASEHLASERKREIRTYHHTGSRIVGRGAFEADMLPVDEGRELAKNRARVKAKEHQRSKLIARRYESETLGVVFSSGGKGEDFRLESKAAYTPDGFPVKRSVGESQKATRQIDRSIKDSTRKTERYVIKAERKSIRASERSVKAAPQTSKAAIKTAQASEKAAQAAAKATAKATKASAKAAQATAKAAGMTAKAIGRAISATSKAIAAATKDFVSAIAAGGWVAGIVIVVICLIGLIAASPFGIFFAGDNRSSDAVPVSVAVSQVNFDFNLQLMSLQSGDYSDITIAGEMADWPEVLAVFAVKVAGSDDVDAMDVATMDPTRIAKLKTVFWDMNELMSTVETIDHPDSNPDDAVDDSWTERILHITITPKTAEDMKNEYHFTDKQKAVLDELLSNRDMLLDLIGDLMFISPDAEALLRNLPENLSEDRRAVVKTACSLVGKVNYFWGGKSLVIGWDPLWGSIQKVWADGNSTSGTYRPYGLDCSGFVDWSFYNASGGSYVIGHGGGATMQHTYCTPISWADALPGDLVFYPGDMHVGIVGGRDEEGNLLIVHCASSYNCVVITGLSGFTAIGRPMYYTE